MQFFKGDSGYTIPLFTLIRKLSKDSRGSWKEKIRHSQIEDSAELMTAIQIKLRLKLLSWLLIPVSHP